MEILTRREFLMRKKELAKKILEGAVFIYPTDTIYGIGCNALKEKAVAKIRKIKKRPVAPFSVWVPSVKWIKDNCKVTKKQEKDHLSLLPGPYTIIAELKNKNCLAKSVHPTNGSIGVRMPDHELSDFFSELGIPIVTTSVNKTGDSFMTQVEDLDPDIELHVDFLISEGEKRGRPSKIINLITDTVIER